MSLRTIGRVVLAGTLALAVLPARAEGGNGHRTGYGRHILPPELRYRDPRYVAPRRGSAPHFVGAPVLIEAYLPRYTQTPMYNEPPSRFPRY